MYKLYKGEAVIGDDREIDIVIIPGVATLPPEAWGQPARSWLQSLVSEPLGSRAQVWVYSYALLSSSTTLMQKIFNEGIDLLESLIDLPRPSKRIPILFVCHSLGGLVLKKALCIARQRHYSYREVIDVISGIVFLGTPHIGYNQADGNDVLNNILHSIPKSKLKFQAVKRDREDLQKLCQQFEVAKLQVRILSAYESQETKQYKNSIMGFWKNRTSIIVGQDTCRVNSENEKLLEIHETHGNICKIDVMSALYSEIGLLLKDITTKAPEQIEERFRPYTGPQGPDQLTLRSKSTFPHGADPKKQDALQNNSTKAAKDGPLEPNPISGQTTAGSTGNSFEHVPLPAPFETGRRDPILPCFLVNNIEQNSKFFGREEELRLIDAHLLPTANTRTLRSFGICGMGGLGKTQIAIQYIYTRRKYFDAIFWLSADKKNALGERFASLAQQLGIEDPTDNKDLTVSRERMKEWLSNPLKSFEEPNNEDNEASWLLVFDNADSLSVLDEYWPATGRGSVLLTSRDPVAKTSFYTENCGIDLSKLSPEASLIFLRSLTKSTTDSDNGRSLRLIAEMLDGLPLGIEQMASIIRRLRVNYADFLQLYERENRRLYEMRPEKHPKGYQHSLATVWSLQQFSPGSETLLQVLSMLDPDSVPESLMTQNLENFDLDGYPTDIITYYDARVELIGASLVSLMNQIDNRQGLRLHRLLQDVVIARMDPSRVETIFKATLQLVSTQWPFQDLHHRHVRDRWSKCAILFPHVAHLKRVAHGIISSGKKLLQIITYATLLNDAGWYLFERGFVEEAQEYFHTVEEICESSESRDTQQVMDLLRDCHNNQGTAANEANDPKGALRHFEIWKDMSLQRRAQDGQAVEDYELGCVYHELGVAYAFNDDYTTAIDNFLRCWHIWEKLEEFKENMLLWPVSNLGFLYNELGRLEEAEDMLLKYLKIQADEFGVDDVETFRTGKLLHALGNVYASMGQMEKSLLFHARALAQYRATLGEGHARTGAACYRLANHYIRLEQFKDAENMLEQANKVYSARKCNLNELARTTYKKSQLLAAQGNETQAHALWSDAYKMRRSILNNDKRPIEEIGEEDYDKLIIFWNR